MLILALLFCIPLLAQEQKIDKPAAKSAEYRRSEEMDKRMQRARKAAAAAMKPRRAPGAIRRSARGLAYVSRKVWAAVY